MALMAIAAGNPARADEVARLVAETCSACHSPELHTTIPALAGRPAAELLRLLLAFRDGSRPATIMDRLTRGYGNDELAAIAGEIAVKGGP